LSRNLDKNAFTAEKTRIKQGLPVKKKSISTVTFISVLLLMVMAGGCFVKFAQANPYMYYEHVDPPAGATPLVISTLSPKSNAVYDVNDIAITFNVNTQGTSLNTLYAVYFKASWMQDNVTVYKQNSHSPEFPRFCSYNETFWNVPDGEYNVVITARGGGGYAEGLTAYSFDMTTISVVSFTIAAPPEVSIVSVENKTYDSSDVPLTFTVNESLSKIAYVLDNQDNTTISGNTTLVGLSNGVHNVTVYAWDTAGNAGFSKTLTFTVAAPESFPTTFVSAVSAASVAAVGAGLLLYHRKHRQEAPQA
jgi:hypothetical protein